MGHVLQGLAFKDAIIASEVITDGFVEHHVATIDVAGLLLRLFVEGRDRGFVDIQLPETPGWPHRSEGHEGLLGIVKAHGFGDVGIRYPISVGQKHVFISDMPHGSGKTPASHGMHPCFEQGNGPVLLIMGVVIGDLRVTPQFQGHITAVPEVVPEVILDDLPLVSQADDEVSEPVVGIGLHDVPKDRLAADGHHGLGAVFGFFPETSSHPSA